LAKSVGRTLTASATKLHPFTAALAFERPNPEVPLELSAIVPAVDDVSVDAVPDVDPVPRVDSVPDIVPPLALGGESRQLKVPSTS
jgi:hypothetical protein